MSGSRRHKNGKQPVAIRLDGVAGQRFSAKNTDACKADAAEDRRTHREKQACIADRQHGGYYGICGFRIIGFLRGVKTGCQNPNA